MTVVLAGVGADQSNVGRYLPLYDDGTFEYIPSPEKTPETDESETFGSWALRDGRIAADPLSEIRPAPGREKSWITDPDRIVEAWNLAAPDADPVALTRKPALRFDLDGDAFVERVGIPGDR